MMHQFLVDLAAPLPHNQNRRRPAHPVTIQQRTSGGRRRALTGPVDFAVILPYPSPAMGPPWIASGLDVVAQLFTSVALTATRSYRS